MLVGRIKRNYGDVHSVFVLVIILELLGLVIKYPFMTNDTLILNDRLKTP